MAQKNVKLDSKKLMAANVKVPFKTLIGELRWVNISEKGADISMAKDGSSFKKVASIVFADETANKMLEIMENTAKSLAAEAGVPEGIPIPIKGYKFLVDSEGNDTGELSLQFKTNTHFADGKPNVVRVYNAKGTEIDLGDKLIGNGSKGVLHGQAAFFYQSAQLFGITLYLKGIQLTKFVEYNGDSIETEDLSDEDDAFIAVEGNAEPIDL